MQNFQGIAFIWTQTYSEGDFQMGYYAEKKNKQEGLRTYFFEIPSVALEFFIFYFNPRNSRLNKAPPLEIPQNCVRFNLRLP